MGTCTPRLAKWLTQSDPQISSKTPRWKPAFLSTLPLCLSVFLTEEKRKPFQENFTLQISRILTANKEKLAWDSTAF